MSQRDYHPSDTGEMQYLYASSDNAHFAWLSRVVGDRGTVLALAAQGAALDAGIARHQPQAVFLDFGDAHAGRSAELMEALRREWPALPVVGIGDSTMPATVLAALRAGADDFVDRAASLEDTADTLQRLHARHGVSPGPTGAGLVLLGARAGMGTTTLAVHLAVALQELLARVPPGPAARPHGVVLLDLGVPERDALLYLNLQSSFSFVDAVHNLRRLDRTLLQTALAYHAGGAAVLPLPADLSEIRQISHVDSSRLIQRLNDFFAFQIADLGGCSIPEFIAQTVHNAGHVWVVCDQGIGGIVSTATLLRRLRDRGIDTDRFGLVVNRHDKVAGLEPRDIADRLGVPLAHVLPARGTALVAAASRGELLAQRIRHDPYGAVVTDMARGLWPDAARGAPPLPADHDWMAFVGQMLGRLKH